MLQRDCYEPSSAKAKTCVAPRSLSQETDELPASRLNRSALASHAKMFSWATPAAPCDDDELREAVSAAVAETKKAMAQVNRLALRKVATEAISRTRAELEGGWAERERSYQQGIATLGAELGAVEVDAQSLGGVVAEQAALLSAECSASEELASSLFSAQHDASAALEQAARDSTISRDRAVKLALAKAAETAGRDRAQASESVSHQFAEARQAALAEARRLTGGALSEEMERAVQVAVAQAERAMADSTAAALTEAVQTSRAEAAAQAQSVREALLAEFAEADERMHSLRAKEQVEANECMERLREEATEQARLEAADNLVEEREQMRAQAKAEAVASMNLQRDNLVAFASAQLNTADSATQERAVALVREQSKQHVQAELHSQEKASLAREGVVVATLRDALQHAESHVDRERANLALLRTTCAGLSAQLESARRLSMEGEARRLVEGDLVRAAITADYEETRDSVMGAMAAQSDARVASACRELRECVLPPCAALPPPPPPCVRAAHAWWCHASRDHDARVRSLQSKLQGKADELALMQRSRQSDISEAAQEAARQTEARMRVAGVTAWAKANKDGKPSATLAPAGAPGARPQLPDLP